MDFTSILVVLGAIVLIIGAVWLRSWNRQNMVRMIAKQEAEGKPKSKLMKFLGW